MARNDVEKKLDPHLRLSPQVKVGPFERTMAATGATQAPAPESDHGPAPTRVGRYTIIREIGSGGMGDVYAAFDEQLDRKVAIKVLRRDKHAGEDWNVRLVREAQAMARLSHPNVITVHEVGEYAGQMFIAMEFIVGETLEAWLAASRRRWQDIIARFIDAGRGLHAAHEAGVVHRDFKPSNTMVGTDGRVRVLDFGLAAPEHLEDRRNPETRESAMMSSSSAAFSRKLTLDGTLLGTPMYMSPEQLGGGAITPASDQFNFCVALFDALYDRHPFLDPPFSLAELRASVMAGPVREPPPQSARGVPGWVLVALRRGLKANVVERFASMAELLAALDRDPARRRRRLLAPAALAGLAAFAGFAVSGVLQREASSCDGGQAVMSGLWSTTRREQIGSAFSATKLSFGATVLDSVVQELDTYTRDWAAMRHDACVAHREGAQSGTMLDARMTCLERSRQALGGALELLANPDTGVVDGGMRLVQALPRIAHCGDIVALAAAVPAPDDPAVAEEVGQLRRRLDAAIALAAVGREDESTRIAGEVVARSRQLGYRPLEAEALLTHGRTMLDAFGERGAVLQVLNDALRVALGVGMDAEAAEALARRAYIVGLEDGHIDEALFNADLASELLRKLSAPGPLLGLLSNNIGAVHVAAGDRVRALARFEQALAVMEGLPGDHTIELSSTLANVAMQLDEGPRRQALLERMVSLRRDKLGEGHPFTAHGVVLAGLYTTDPRVAAEFFERGCASLDRLPGDRILERRQCRVFLGNARAEAGQSQAALLELRRALALESPEFDATADGLMALATARGHVALLAGASESVLAELRRVQDSVQGNQDKSWWRRLDIAELQLALALNLEATGADSEALVLLDQVIPILAGIAEQRRELAVSQRLATAHLCRARARLRPLDAPAEVRAAALQDLQLAEAWYRGAGAGYSWRLTAIAQWRKSMSL